MAPFSIVDVFDEVDDKLYAFEQLYHEILNEHAPLKQTIVRGNQVPYMTEQWRKAQKQIMAAIYERSDGRK